MYCAGDKLAMVDMMLWPWFERIGLLEKSAPSVIPSKSTFPKVFAWTQAMLQQPAVKATYFDIDTHIKFYVSFKNGKADYDVGLEP